MLAGFFFLGAAVCHERLREVKKEFDGCVKRTHYFHVRTYLDNTSMTAKPLKHSDVALGNLLTYSACADALEGMEMCASNVMGGNKAFFSGKQTFFTTTAHKNTAPSWRR